MTPLNQRIQDLQERIRQACDHSGRMPNSVELLPVSKRQPSTLIRSAAGLGFQTFGENYVQEGMMKAVEMADLRFVLIGPLQRNKAKPALEHFQEIMTLDRPELVSRMIHLAEDLDLDRKVWIQVDLWGETTKLGGCPENGIDELYHMIEGSRLDLQGFMAIPPPGNSQAFRDLARLREAWRQRTGLPLRLSMGMSDDLEEAIAAGTDQVRIGTAFFGERI